MSTDSLQILQILQILANFTDTDIPKIPDTDTNSLRLVRSDTNSLYTDTDTGYRYMYIGSYQVSDKL